MFADGAEVQRFAYMDNVARGGAADYAQVQVKARGLLAVGRARFLRDRHRRWIMGGRVDKFMKILSVEVEDLVSDVQHEITGQRDRFDKDDITEYVMKENVALAQGEILSIRRFESWVEGLDFTPFDSIEAACDHIRAHVYEHMRGSARCPFVMELLERKMQKVHRFCEQVD